MAVEAFLDTNVIVYPKKENEVAIWAQNPPPRAERGLIQGRDGRVLILGSSTEQQ